jgi:signal transduction histidine kinase
MRLGEGVRQLSRQLHPVVLEYGGIAAALRSYGAEFSGVHGIGISVDAVGEFENVPPAVGLCLYRVAQEALQNVAKHSKAKQATVRLERGAEYVSLVIKDWGQGFQEMPDGAERGLGLVSMGERVRLVNGGLNIQSSPGEGTTVTVSIPC